MKKKYTEEEAIARKKESTKKSYDKKAEIYRERAKQKYLAKHPEAKTRKPKETKVSHICSFIYPGTDIECHRKVLGDPTLRCWQHRDTVSSCETNGESEATAINKLVSPL